MTRRIATRRWLVPLDLALLLETPDGGCAAIVIVKERAGLAAANELLAGWSPDERPAPWASPSRQLTGEVIVQKGL